MYIVYDSTYNSRETIAVWQILGQDTQLTASILDYILDTLTRSLPYEEKAGRDKDDVTRVATLLPVTVRFFR